MTSNVRRLLFGDYKVKAWREAGLLFPSTVTAIVRTIPAAELHAVENKLRDVLQL